MNLEIDLEFLFTEVKAKIVELIEKASGEHQYDGYNVNPEDERYLKKYLTMENIIFNYELLLQNNLMLFFDLQERFVSIEDPQELKIIKTLLKIIRATEFQNFSNLVIVDSYIVNKEHAAVFNGAIKNTPFSIANRLRDPDKKETGATLVMVLNAQRDRVKLYLNGVDINLVNNYVEEGITDDNYEAFLRRNIKHALDILDHGDEMINHQAYINKLYFEYFLDQYLKNPFIQEPSYDLVARYGNKKIH